MSVMRRRKSSVNSEFQLSMLKTSLSMDPNFQVADPTFQLDNMDPTLLVVRMEPNLLVVRMDPTLLVVRMNPTLPGS